MRDYGLQAMNFSDVQSITDADCLIFAVDHDAFRDFTTEQLKAFTTNSYAGNKSVVIDIKNMYDKEAVEAEGLAYWGL